MKEMERERDRYVKNNDTYVWYNLQLLQLMHDNKQCTVYMIRDQKGNHANRECAQNTHTQKKKSQRHDYKAWNQTNVQLKTHLKA